MNMLVSPVGIESPKRRVRNITNFHWTEENIAIAAEMWGQGYTSSSIGERLGVSRSSVTAVASMHRDRFPSRLGAAKGTTSKNGKRVGIPPDWLRKAVALWMSGKNANEIAKATGIKGSTVYHRIYARPDLFPAVRMIVAAPAAGNKTYIGNDRWVDRVPYTTISGAVVSLPRISILNGKEG